MGSLIIMQSLQVTRQSGAQGTSGHEVWVNWRGYAQGQVDLLPCEVFRGPAGFCGCGVAWGLVEDKAEEVW